MRRYLVVANQTLGGDLLAETVKERLAAGPCTFHVVVPATYPTGHFTATEGQARVVAEQRLAEALGRFRALGADVDGEVGDHNPLDAMRDALRHREVDEIILSTLPPGASRWLHADLPHRAEREFRLPITHVITMVSGEPVPAL